MLSNNISKKHTQTNNVGHLNKHFDGHVGASPDFHANQTCYTFSDEHRLEVGQIQARLVEWQVDIDRRGKMLHRNGRSTAVSVANVELHYTGTDVTITTTRPRERAFVILQRLDTSDGLQCIALCTLKCIVVP